VEAYLTVTEMGWDRSPSAVPNKGDMMVKVLIYSSKEIYDTAPFEGRAEAHIVGYRKDDGYYEIVKNRTNHYMGSHTTYSSIKTVIRWAENDEWNFEKESYDLKEKYKDHPFIELS
jgi:hypothetical protein